MPVQAAVADPARFESQLYRMSNKPMCHTAYTTKAKNTHFFKSTAVSIHPSIADETCRDPSQFTRCRRTTKSPSAGTFLINQPPPRRLPWVFKTSDCQRIRLSHLQSDGQFQSQDTWKTTGYNNENHKTEIARSTPFQISVKHESAQGHKHHQVNPDGWMGFLVNQGTRRLIERMDAETDGLTPRPHLTLCP